MGSGGRGGLKPFGGILGTKIDFELWNKQRLGMNKRLSTSPRPQKLQNKLNKYK